MVTATPEEPVTVFWGGAPDPKPLDLNEMSWLRLHLDFWSWVVLWAKEASVRGWAEPGLHPASNKHPSLQKKGVLLRPVFSSVKERAG